MQEGHQGEDDACAGENGESERQVADADLCWVMAVDIVTLCRPEENDTEETRTTDEGQPGD